MHKKIISYWVPLILWCSLIYYLSSIPNLKTNLGIIDFILRKIAHFVEYAVLFILSLRAFWGGPQKPVSKGFYICALLFSLFYALSDEYHQSFVLGRVCSARDVGIDSLGIFGGMIAASFERVHNRFFSFE
jgi:VanZ family protein